MEFPPGCKKSGLPPWIGPFAPDFFDSLDFWRRQMKSADIRPWLVYGGDDAQPRGRGHVMPWSGIGKLLEAP